jgi:hypothetical protein
MARMAAKTEKGKRERGVEPLPKKARMEVARPSWVEEYAPVLQSK